MFGEPHMPRGWNGSWGVTDWQGWYGYAMQMRHLGGANLSFCDGHVEHRSGPDLANLHHLCGRPPG